MSTKCSEVYLEDEDVHLFSDVKDETDCLYLSMPTRGAWEINPAFTRVPIERKTWDKLVDAYVAERERKRRAAEKRRRKIMRCLRKHGEHEWEEVDSGLAALRSLLGNDLGPRCSRCGGYAFEDPSELERLADVARPKTVRDEG